MTTPPLILTLLNGKTIPLADCSWVLASPDGGTHTILSAASQFGVIAADEDAAWDEFFDGAHNRKRTIETRKRQGWTVKLVHRNNAVEALREAMKEKS